MSNFLGKRISRWREHALISEFSGMFGDMGTLVPLLVSLSKSNQINLTASLFFGGFFNIFTGLYFDVPICVQPMKSISALAISNNLSIGEVTAAGFFVSAVVFVLGATRLIRVVTRLVPHAVIRGIQMGAGIVLVSKGVATIYQSNQWGFANWAWMDNFVIALLTYLFIAAYYLARRTPSALILFGIGLIFGLVRLYVAKPANAADLGVGPQFMAPFVPTFNYRSLVVAGLGQLPLTCLNSVIAVSILADDLYPLLAHPVASTSDIAVSVGVMNMLSAWFGSIPYCHGAGGLAAQHRFGARTGLAVVSLGALKVLVALLLGNSISGLLNYFPNSILGVMMCLSGVELASPARDAGLHPSGNVELGKRRWTVTVVTAATLVGFNNDGLGFLTGLVCAVVFGVVEEVEACRETTGRPFDLLRLIGGNLVLKVYNKVHGVEDAGTTLSQQVVDPAKEEDQDPGTVVKKPEVDVEAACC
ncbi:hypothetical protein M427DRAFT_110884 [Gonapodya prolifera JEL478]|uniref:Sulfate transporter n=1 Tax=Gonapodya prolifera (strain JEL478) TaxID=1344416 RepID=A0A139AID0_GONPJ|nr:hypothetical protein M427DRAFT_110884 [Gonapodya prolifera JEL478]|eukprot:KXS16571.1 hypothetical protein M427DRAFT_110884 [Gonapodya prolifera JEL478]